MDHGEDTNIINSYTWQQLLYSEMYQPTGNFREAKCYQNWPTALVQIPQLGAFKWEEYKQHTLGCVLLLLA